MTIAVYEESVGIQPRENWELLPNEWLDVKFNNPALRVAKAYKGREMIILLTIPYKSSVETLQIAGVYFVINLKMDLFWSALCMLTASIHTPSFMLMFLLI